MKNGKIAKEHDFFDMMSMVAQLTEGDVNADGTKPGVFWLIINCQVNFLIKIIKIDHIHL